jgi:hypothetical protein
MAQREDTNVIVLTGRVTHPPDYRPEHGNLLTFSLAIHSSGLSDRIDDPMYVDVKVTGVNESTYKAIVVGHELRIVGSLQSRTFKKNGLTHRYQHIHVAHPHSLTFLSKPKEVRQSDEPAAEPAPAGV